MTNVLNKLISKFMPFAQKRMGFNEPPRLFLKNDDKNANNPLGKTAHYDPSEKSVTLYITGRHPKDVMRSLSHELVHHTQNCRGEFDNSNEMGEGYAQNDEHLREMEREAYEVGNMCFRDWEDSIKQTIYFEHLQKGEKKMSTKDWKNKEISTLLSEAWGFKFNTLEEFNEFNGTGEIQTETEEEVQTEGEEEVQTEGEEEVQTEGEEETVDEGEDHDDEDKMEEGEDREDDDDAGESLEENTQQIFAPNHYCVHHGGVEHNGAVQMAEAVGHNWNEKLGKVTAYDMKLEDGTILENVAVEDIQVTNASLAEGHGDHPAKRDDDEDSKKDHKKGDKKHMNEDDIEEVAAKRAGNEDRDVGRDRMHADRMHENEDALREAIKAVLTKHLKG
jgi:hypothetical protein